MTARGGNAILAAAGGFSVDAGAGNDTVSQHATGSGDSFTLGAGHDMLIVKNTAPGASQFDGGLGRDTLDFSNISFAALDGVEISLRDGTITNAAPATDTITNFEAVLGSDGNEVIEGNNLSNNLSGNGGNDTIRTYLGDDTVGGGAGNDWVFGGNQADDLTGGDGDETVLGEQGNDTLSAGAGLDLLRGGLDRDSLDGGDGADTLYGDNGADTILGGPGADTL